MLLVMNVKQALWLGLVSTCLLGGCGGAKPEDPAKAGVSSEPKAIPVTGTYKLDVEDLKRRFVDSLGGQMNSLARSMYVQLGQSEGTIVLMDEGRFSMNLGGDEVGGMEGTWAVDGDNLALTSGESVQAATLNGGKITMVVDKTSTGTRTFVRQKPAASQQNKD